MKRGLLTGGAMLAVLAGSTLAISQPQRTDWPNMHRDAGAQRYSPLTQITPANVGRLQKAWSYHLKPAGVERLRPSQATPLVIEGTMVICSSYGQVIALDPVTEKRNGNSPFPMTIFPPRAAAPTGRAPRTVPPRWCSARAADGFMCCVFPTAS